MRNSDQMTIRKPHFIQFVYRWLPRGPDGSKLNYWTLFFRVPQTSMSVDSLSLRNFVRVTMPLFTLIINVLTKYWSQYMVQNYISSFFSPEILLFRLKISNFFTWRDFWHLHFIKSTFQALNYYLSFWQNMKGHQKSKVKYIGILQNRFRFVDNFLISYSKNSI